MPQTGCVRNDQLRQGLRRFFGRGFVRAGIALLLLSISLGYGTFANAQVPPPPSPGPAAPGFDAVKAAAELHFAALKGRKPGDLITQQDVSPLFPKLNQLGWDVEEKKQILASILKNNDPLVKALRTPDGTKLMRRVSGLPEGYDRMDRLRVMPLGMRRIHEMITGPDGHLLFEYMVATPGGRNLGEQLSRTKKGEDFNQPTGRLYTAKDVLERLAASYNVQFDKKPPAVDKTRQPPPK